MLLFRESFLGIRDFEGDVFRDHVLGWKLRSGNVKAVKLVVCCWYGVCQVKKRGSCACADICNATLCFCVKVG